MRIIVMAKKLQKNKRRVVASVLGLLMVMQQSATYPVLATQITNSAGQALKPNGNGEYDYS